RDEHVAEEVTQETFYQALKSIDRFDGSCQISTWLCAIAKNQLQSYRRKNPSSESFDGLTENNISGMDNQTADSAEKEALGRMEHVELLRQLHNLQEPYREIFYLRVFGNLSFK
ncbi:MAG: sigma-70 family RNA polymerase sigma factor, partial [Eubacteriaceae bacterium]|nr:sigma-70 family RNA polymerase sigma factor [Eubacteriaceae bacterium]